MGSVIINKLKLAIVSQPEYFRAFYENDLDAVFKEVREFKYTFSMTENDFEDLLEYDADVNIFFRGEFFPQQTLLKLKGLKVDLSSEPFPNQVAGKLNYTYDSILRYEAFSEIYQKSFDYVFHYDESSLAFLKSQGLYLSGAFPFPVATKTYRPLDLQKNWDLFFIGRSTPHRENYFGPLKHEHHFLHIAHGIFGSELASLANKAKIVLNVHAENETSWEPRVQLFLATKTLLISEAITPNKFLVANQDYVSVDTPNEMKEAVQYYLSHPDEANEIAERGYQKVLKFFDSKQSFINLVTNIVSKKTHPFKSDVRQQKKLTLIKILSKLRSIIKSS